MRIGVHGSRHTGMGFYVNNISFSDQMEHLGKPPDLAQHGSHTVRQSGEGTMSPVLYLRDLLKFNIR